MNLTIYLSGEIHSNWRDEVKIACQKIGLSIEFLQPVTDHEKSDECGTTILGSEESGFWKDHKSAKINAIRTQTMIERADILVVRFSDQYRQWNAAFEAGYAHAIGTPVITLHSPELTHPLKEIDGAAMAVAETPEQVVNILRYILQSTG